MKDNSKKLLLWLYPVAAKHAAVRSQAQGSGSGGESDVTGVRSGAAQAQAQGLAQSLAGLGSQRRRVPESDLEWLLADLTDSGRRSLLRVLIDKELIFSDEISGQTRLAISSYGMSQLEAQIPALNLELDGWKGDWSLILFLQAPEHDKRFRYLRTQLVKQHCFALKRGVYLYPGPLPAQIKNLLQQDYRSAVAAVTVKQWQIGDQQIIIGREIKLRDLIDVYSGLSRELKSLLNNFEHRKSLMDRQKQPFFSIFDRLYQSLLTDLGLIPYFFPQGPSGLKILAKMQTSLLPG
jgi:hypothetical protein